MFSCVLPTVVSVDRLKQANVRNRENRYLLESKLRITRQHNMSEGEARDWIGRELVKMLDEFGDRVSDTSSEWDRDTLNFRFRVGGIVQFRGSLRVTGDTFALDLPFPLLARGYQRTAEAQINDWLDRNLPG